MAPIRRCAQAGAMSHPITTNVPLDATQQHLVPQIQIPRVRSPQHPPRPQQQLRQAHSRSASDSPDASLHMQRQPQQTAELSGPSTEKACQNCGTQQTPLWRPFDGVQLCNACGIYRRHHGTDRPLELINTAGLRSHPGGGLPPLEPAQEALAALYDEHSQRRVDAPASAATILTLQQQLQHMQQELSQASLMREQQQALKQQDSHRMQSPHDPQSPQLQPSEPHFRRYQPPQLLGQHSAPPQLHSQEAMMDREWKGFPPLKTEEAGANPGPPSSEDYPQPLGTPRGSSEATTIPSWQAGSRADSSVHNQQTASPLPAAQGRHSARRLQRWTGAQAEQDEGSDSGDDLLPAGHARTVVAAVPASPFGAPNQCGPEEGIGSDLRAAADALLHMRSDVSAMTDHSANTESFDSSDESYEDVPTPSRPALGRKRNVPQSSARSPPPPAGSQQTCHHCLTPKTPLWRKDRASGHVLCNACGIYTQTHGHPRPLGPPNAEGVCPTLRRATAVANKAAAAAAAVGAVRAGVRKRRKAVTRSRSAPDVEQGDSDGGERARFTPPPLHAVNPPRRLARLPEQHSAPPAQRTLSRTHTSTPPTAAPSLRAFSAQHHLTTISHPPPLPPLHREPDLSDSAVQQYVAQLYAANASMTAPPQQSSHHHHQHQAHHLQQQLAAHAAVQQQLRPLDVLSQYYEQQAPQQQQQQGWRVQTEGHPLPGRPPLPSAASYPAGGPPSVGSFHWRLQQQLGRSVSSDQSHPQRWQ